MEPLVFFGDNLNRGLCCVFIFRNLNGILNFNGSTKITGEMCLQCKCNNSFFAQAYQLPIQICVCNLQCNLGTMYFYVPTWLFFFFFNKFIGQVYFTMHNELISFLIFNEFITFQIKQIFTVGTQSMTKSIVNCSWLQVHERERSH